jgi:hypothetical protein
LRDRETRGISIKGGFLSAEPTARGINPHLTGI